MTRLTERLARKYWDLLKADTDASGEGGWELRFDATEELDKALSAGRVKPREVLDWVKAAYAAGWDDFDLGHVERMADRMLRLQPLLRKLRGKRTVHVTMLTSGPGINHVIVHPSARPGERHKYQITRFDRDLRPVGHEMWSGNMETALEYVWKEFGPFKITVAESVLSEARSRVSRALRGGY